MLKLLTRQKRIVAAFGVRHLTSKQNRTTTKITTQTDLSTLSMDDKRKTDFLNPASVLDPNKADQQSIPNVNKEIKQMKERLKPTPENIEKLSKAPGDSGNPEQKLAYMGLDKAVPEYPKIAEEVKAKAASLKMKHVDEKFIKPKNGFKSVPLQQEVGFEQRKATSQLRKETGVGDERATNTAVPESMRHEEDSIDMAREKTRNAFESVKESAGIVVEKIKETAEAIVEKAEEKEKKKTV